MADFLGWAGHLFWLGLTTAPPVVSSNWAGVIFGVIVSAVKEFNALRQNRWKFKGTELLWSVLIGVCAWIGLATVNAAYLEYKDHTQLSIAASTKDLWQESTQTLAAELSNRRSPGRPKPPWKRGPGPQEGPIGPIEAWEITQWFSERRPCIIRITSAQDKPEFDGTLRWLLTEGAKCKPDETGNYPIDVDKASNLALAIRSKLPGITVHWNQGVGFGDQVANYLNASGFKTQISHQMPPDAPRELIWLDIGPGSPWK